MRQECPKDIEKTYFFLGLKLHGTGRLERFNLVAKGLILGLIYF